MTATVCPKCAGLGYIRTRTGARCSYCHGTGTVPVRRDDRHPCCLRCAEQCACQPCTDYVKLAGR